MLDLDPFIQHLVPFVLVTFRVGGLILTGPVISGRSAPMTFKALLAVMFSVAVYPMVTPLDIPPLTLVTVLALILSESLIGVAIGMIAHIPLICLETAGSLMGHQMGLALAKVYNPEIGDQGDVIGQLLFVMGLGTFVMIGGVEAMLIMLLHTFERVPVGGFDIATPPLETYVAVFSSGMEFATRVAAPVWGCVFLLLVAMGFMMKTMPQINVLSVGFSAKIMCGISMLAGAIFIINGVTIDEYESALQAVATWVGGL